MSHAFVGEEAPAATWAPSSSVLGTIGGALPYALLVGVLIAASLLGAFTTPFHYVDALAVVAVAVVPTLLCLGVFAAQDGRITPAMLYGPTRKTMRNRLLTLVVAAVFVPGNLVLCANEYFDHSPAEDLVATVHSTWTRTSRGNTSYMAGIKADQAGAIALASPLGSLSFYYYGEQPVRLSRRDYDRLTPGHSALVLKVHRGLFHFPWFERSPTVLP